MSKLTCYIFHGYRRKYKFIEKVEPEYCFATKSVDYIATYRNVCSCGCVRGRNKVLFTGYNDVFTWGKKSLFEALLSARASLFMEVTK
jgi:hypothetical protein